MENMDTDVRVSRVRESQSLSEENSFNKWIGINKKLSLSEPAMLQRFRFRFFFFCPGWSQFRLQLK